MIIETDSTEKFRAALRKVVDPEVGLNIVDLGLVYAITQDEHGVTVDLTMTSPACPMGEGIVAEAEYELAAILPDNVGVAVNLVWDPPWSPAKMSEKARTTLGWES